MAKIRTRGSSQTGAITLNLQEFGTMRNDIFRLIERIIREGFKQILETNPRDTGYSSWNWRVQYQGEEGGVLGEKDKDRKYPQPMTTYKRESSKFTDLRKEEFSRNFKFTNYTPYIYELEHKTGTDYQFFVRKAVARMRDRLKTAQTQKSNVRSN